MNNEASQTNSRLLVYFVLAAIFAALSILVSRYHVLSLPTTGFTIGLRITWLSWMCACVSAAALFPLIAAIFKTLHERKVLPAFMDVFFRQTVQGRLSEAATRHFLPIVLSIAAAGILLLVLLIAKSEVVRDKDVDTAVYQLASLFSGRNTSVSDLEHVAIGAYFTESNDQTAYLNDCITIVERMKEAGARAVLVPFPDYPLTNALLKQFRLLERTGITVLGLPVGNSFYIGDSSGPIPLAKGYFDLDIHSYSWGKILVEIRPLFGRPMNDIFLELLRKYRGYSSDVTPELAGSELRFGNDHIPVSAHGSLYSRDRMREYDLFTLFITRSAPWKLSTVVTPSSQTLRVERLGVNPITGNALFMRIYKQSTRASFPSLESMPLEQLSESVKGKIVLLTTNYERTILNSFSTRGYAVTLENILSGRVTRRPEFGFVWVTVALLLMAGVCSYYFRPLLSVLYTLLLAIATIYVGALLFDKYDLLIDIFYPLVALAIAAFSFPLLKFSVVTGRGRRESV